MTPTGNAKIESRNTKFEKRNSRVPPDSHSAMTWHLRTPLLPLCLCVIFFFSLVPVSRAQDLDKPSVNIDEDVTAFAFAPDGRVAYSVRRMYRNKKYDMQRDD